jgi:hypothetical protein
MKTIKEYFDEYVKNPQGKQYLSGELLMMIEESFYMGFGSCLEHILNNVMNGSGKDIWPKIVALKEELTEFIETKFPDPDKKNK